MRKLSFFVLWFLCFSSAFALDPQAFQDPKLQSSYDQLRAELQGRYQAIYPFRDADYKRVMLLEKTISASYKKAADAKTPQAKKLLDGRIRMQVRSLERLLDTIDENKKPTIAQAPPVLAEASNPSTDASLLYYADSFEGEHTANGNTFRHDGFSAARCNIDINSLVQVRYGGKGVIVKVNDRPNCSRHPDIVDLTKAAFQTLAPLSRGKLDGSFVPLQAVRNGLVKEYLPQDFFSNYDIKLDANLPDIYLPNETLRISGATTAGANETLVYVIAPSGKAITLGQENIDGSRFEYFLPLDEVGDYQFVVASGRAFAGAKSLGFTVLDPKTIAGKAFAGSVSPAGAVSLTAQRVESGDLTPTNLVRVNGLPDNTLRSVKIVTPNLTFSRTGMSAIAFAPTELAAIPDGTKATVQVTARASSTPFSIDTYTDSTTLLSEDYVLAPAYTTERHENIDSGVEDSVLRVSIGKGVTKKIRNHAYLIAPSGGVEEISFDSKHVGPDGTLANNDGASFSKKLTEEGVYIVEVLYDTGFAAYQAPIVNGKVLTVLPNVYDLASKDVSNGAATATQDMLDSINAIRAKRGLSALSLDSSLTRLAQFKAQDMADNNYVGHVDSEGGYILDTAKRAGVELHGSVGENVAGGTVSAGYLQAGLLLSGAHRANMLGKDWKSVGIGIVSRGGRVWVTQVYSD